MTTQNETQFYSNDIECDNCARIITQALSALPGVETVTVDVPGKTVRVVSDTAKPTMNEMLTAMEDAGFDAQSVV